MIDCNSMRSKGVAWYFHTQAADFVTDNLIAHGLLCNRDAHMRKLHRQ